MSKRVLVLNQYYPPDAASTGHIAAEICVALSRRGAEVTVVTGQPSYTADAADAAVSEVRDGVAIKRVSMGRRKGRQTVATRLLGYGRFLFLAWRESRRVGHVDVVVTFHNPPMLGALGLLLARSNGVPFVYVVQDIHPDILVKTGWPGLPKSVIRAWRAVNRATLSRAAHVITLTDEMKRYVQRHYGVAPEKVTAIPVWGQPELLDLQSDAESQTNARVALGLGLRPAELLVLAAGNMGVMHPVESLAHAAETLRDRPVTFLFVGDGERRRNLEDLARQMSLDNVRFLPFQSASDFESLIVAADLCVVVLAVGLEDLCLPSRSMTFMSAGRPILAVMAKEAPLVQDLDRTSAGWSTTTPEGVVRIVDEILAARAQLVTAGRAARALYRDKYQKEDLLRQYVDAILGA